MRNFSLVSCTYLNHHYFCGRFRKSMMKLYLCSFFESIKISYCLPKKKNAKLIYYQWRKSKIAYLIIITPFTFLSLFIFIWHYQFKKQVYKCITFFFSEVLRLWNFEFILQSSTLTIFCCMLLPYWYRKGK